MSNRPASEGELREGILRFFEERHDVAAAYLLPEAHHRPGTPSPVDVGVLFHPLVERTRYEEARLEIGGGLAVELRLPEVRLLVLNELSPNLAYDMVRRGERIFNGSPDVADAFHDRVRADFLRSVHPGDERSVPANFDLPDLDPPSLD